MELRLTKKDRIIMVKRIVEGKTPNAIKKQKVVEALNKVLETASFFNGYEVTVTIEANYSEQE